MVSGSARLKNRSIKADAGVCHQITSSNCIDAQESHCFRKAIACAGFSDTSQQDVLQRLDMRAESNARVEPRSLAALSTIQLEFVRLWDGLTRVGIARSCERSMVKLSCAISAPVAFSLDVVSQNKDNEDTHDSHVACDDVYFGVGRIALEHLRVTANRTYLH
jgi:hypothetical protein